MIEVVFQSVFWNTIQFLCRCKAVVATGISTSTNEAYGKVAVGVIGGGGIPTSTNEAYGKVVGGVIGGGGIPTSTNEAYGKVVGGERRDMRW